MSIIPIFVYEAFDKRTRNPFLLLSTKSSGLGPTPAQFSCLGNFCQGEESSFNHRHFYRNKHYKKKLCVIVAVVMSCLHGIVDLLTQIGTCPILYQRKIRYTVYIYAKNLEIRHIARGEIRKLVNSYG